MNNERRTLVLLTPGFPRSETDINCLPLLQSLVLALNRDHPQLDITVLSFQYPYVKKKYTWHGNTVMSFNGRNKGGIARLLLRGKIMAVLKKIHQQQNISGLLSCWYGECAWVGNRSAGKHALKHFCWILGQDARNENKYPDRVKAPDHELLALSDFIQDEFEKNHGTRPQWVLPPGIDPSQFDNVQKEKDIDLLAAGSLITLKQFDVFIDIVAQLAKKMPAIKTMLVGDGPEIARLHGLIEVKGLRSNIILSGELPQPELLQWMQRTRVFLHPSSYEGFGLVCLEALHAGCRVISFCKPMQQDIENWHIVTNREEMRDTAWRLLQQQDQGKPVTPFTIHNTAVKLVALFDDRDAPAGSG